MVSSQRSVFLVFCSSPVIVEIPHFGSMRGKERELIVLRSDNGDTWKEHQSEVRTEDLTDLLAGMDEGLFICFVLKGFPLVFTMGRLVSP